MTVFAPDNQIPSYISSFALEMRIQLAFFVYASFDK